MAKASGNPLAAMGTRKAPASAAKKTADIIPSQDIKTYDGNDYTKVALTEAVNAFVEGSELFDQGKTMRDTNRVPILALARTVFAKNWQRYGKRPDNPIVATDELGRGKTVKVIFQNSSNKMDETSYATLANLIGAAKAEEVTLKRDDFLINPDVLEQEVEVSIGGKKSKMRVMDAIAKALQSAFAPSPEILENLFQIVPKFETRKDLIDMGLQLVGSANAQETAIRLAQFLEVGRFTTQLKPGALGND